LHNPSDLKYTTTDIIQFLFPLSGDNKIKPDSDIFHDVGMVGDDFHLMIEEYAKKFAVDMTDYLWYFHSDEEGWGIGFFKAPYELVKRIPVTPALLAQFANTGKWDIPYPEHQLPKNRYDLVIKRILSLIPGFVAGFIVIVIILWLIVK
jgi:hypothetical protein